MCDRLKKEGRKINRGLAVPSKNGRAVPITQIADIRYEQEEGIVWRRNRLPTVTVRAAPGATHTRLYELV